MTAQFNPFARSKLKIAEPLSLVSSEYDGWTQTYKIEYRASRSAANVGLLGKQFKIGTPLVVHGKHVVVRSATFTHTNSSIDEVTIRVEAVDFAAVLNGALNATPKATEADLDDSLGQAKPKPVPLKFGPTTRRILA